MAVLKDNKKGDRPMTKFKIKLETVNNVALFVAVCGEYDFDIDVHINRYTVDGKSIMGMMSFSPEREVYVEIYTEDEEKVQRFKQDISLWLVEED